MNTYRTEHDFLGEFAIPADRYYGIQTQRAVENFPISGVPISHFPQLVRALAFVKKAAAQTNIELEELEERFGNAIIGACDEILEGKLHGEFVVDAIQGGAGTSTNMNANEVIANRALELLGLEKGEYSVLHPNTHVNMAQSTNDVYPSALRIALHLKLGELVESMAYLREAMDAKGDEFREVVKMGRTQMQDAVPMTLGQEFRAWATTLGEDVQRVGEARDLICEINLGGTAIGTGICAHPDYPRLVVEKLAVMTGIRLCAAPDLVEATQDTGALVQLSGVLKRVAVKLSKTCNDLRLLSSGPRAGIGEINLPRVQPGSSIMPGKVNPVIPEVVNQVAYHVIGSDLTVTMAAEAGQLELNAMEPVIAFNLFHSIQMLARACRVLADRCISGITANEDRCREMVESSIGLATALNPVLGYEKSAEVAQEAWKSGRTVAEVVLEKGYLTQEELNDVLSVKGMMGPRCYFRKDA